MANSPAIQTILDSKHGVTPEMVKRLTDKDVVTLFSALRKGAMQEYRTKISEAVMLANPAEATPYFLAEAANTQLSVDARATAVNLLFRFAGRTVALQLAALLREPGLPELLAEKILIDLNRIGDATAANAVQAFMKHERLGPIARLGYNVMQSDEMTDFSTPKETAPLRATTELKELSPRRISLSKDKIVLPANEAIGIRLADAAITYTCGERNHVIAFNADLAKLDTRKSMIAGIVFHKKQFQDAYESVRVILAIQSGPRQYKLSVQTFAGRNLNAGTINGADFEIYALSGVPNAPVKITGKLVNGEPTFTAFQSGEQVTGKRTPSELPRSFTK